MSGPPAGAQRAGAALTHLHCYRAGAGAWWCVVCLIVVCVALCDVPVLWSSVPSRTID